MARIEPKLSMQWFCKMKENWLHLALDEVRWTTHKFYPAETPSIPIKTLGWKKHQDCVFLVSLWMGTSDSRVHFWK